MGQYLEVPGAPKKTRIFAWKVSKDILPTELNKFGRHLEANPVCDILCGSGRGSSYHATVLCPQARALRDAMRHRQHGELLDELQFRYTCKLRMAPAASGQMLNGPAGAHSPSRTWYVHNSITDNAGNFSVAESVRGLSAKLLGKLHAMFRAAPRPQYQGQADNIISASNDQDLQKGHQTTPSQAW